MKISKETLATLKNFAAINSNIAFKKGSVLSTISPQRNIMASVTVPEVFDVDFYIYDLSQFLGVVSLFEDPDITFSAKVATFKNGKNSIKYYAADPSVLLLPPDKQIKFPSDDVTFTMDASTLTAISRTASVLSAPDLSIVGDGKTLVGKVCDLKNSSNNVFEVELGETDKKFTANFQISNLKMVNQDYTVCLSAKKLSRWTAVEGDMMVYVALETTSAF